VDGDTARVWLRNSMYTTSGFTSVKWYNEMNGGPQYISVVNLETYVNLGMTFSQQ